MSTPSPDDFCGVPIDAEQAERMKLASKRVYEQQSPFSGESHEPGANGMSDKTVKPYTLWRPSQFLAHQVDPNGCLLGAAYLESGQWTSLIGIGGLGKTRIALCLALCQIVLRQWCNIPTAGEPQLWVILSTENGIRRWKADLEKMLLNFTDAERTVIEDHLLIMAMTPDEDGDLNLGNPETIQRLKLTLSGCPVGALILDPFADMVDGDENKTPDLVHTLRVLRGITTSSCPKAAVLIIHHARTGASNVVQAADNFNAGNFGRGSKALYSKVRCEIQLSPADRDNSNRFVLSCGKSNDCPKFDPRCVVFDPETFTYSVDPNFDLDAWRADVSGKQKQSTVSIADIVTFVHQKCPIAGDETDTKSVISEFEGSGASDRTIQNYIKLAIESGYLRRGKKRWNIRMGAKPLPKD